MSLLRPGWWVFGRNFLLASLAGLLIVSGRGNSGASLLACLADLQGGQLVLFVLILVVIVLLLATLRSLRVAVTQQATILEKVEVIQKAMDAKYGAFAAVERGEAVPQQMACR